VRRKNMIEINVEIRGDSSYIAPTIINAHEHNVKQLVFTNDWPEDEEDYTGAPLIKTIVFITPGGVSLPPAEIIDNKVPLTSSMLDNEGYLSFTIYGKVPGDLVHNTSGKILISAALSDLGGIAPSAYSDITSDCINATEASIAQTELCESATTVETDIVKRLTRIEELLELPPIVGD
jgi:hypothetical protein